MHLALWASSCLAIGIPAHVVRPPRHFCFCLLLLFCWQAQTAVLLPPAAPAGGMAQHDVTAGDARAARERLRAHLGPSCRLLVTGTTKKKRKKKKEKKEQESNERLAGAGTGLKQMGTPKCTCMACVRALPDLLKQQWQFALVFLDVVYLLLSTVVSGINLRKTDFFGTPDPFVKISIGNEGYSSKPAKKTLSPVWNQTFVLFVVYSGGGGCNHKREQSKERKTKRW